MKKLNKVLVMVLAVIMTLAMSASVFAQTEATGKGGKASITINNPAKGETYKLYKLFDATVSEDGQISYQGTVPSSLSAYFKADANGYISPIGEIVVTDASGKVTGTKMTDNLKADLETWAGSETVTASADSNGDPELVFTQLPYGYYVMMTTHKNGKVDDANAKSLISVTSTMPDATINDKNINKPSAKKTVGKETYSIGDTIKYTVSFDTTNYMTEANGNDVVSKQVVEYVIEDTLPEYLSNVTVTSIKIGGATATVQQFDANKKITIPWATKDTTVDPPKYTSLYAQGAKIEIEYEAVLTSTTNINAADTNTVKITPYVDNGNDNPDPWNESWEDSTEIKTYAAALRKVDEKGEPLAGATFTFKGLTVTGTNGVYTVVSYDPNGAESAPLATDADGKLYIVGLASDAELTVTEYEAPDGYSKAAISGPLKPQILTHEVYTESGTRYYDADGNLVSEQSASATSKSVEKNLSDLDEKALVVENLPGVVLPGTGGIGTTIFYILGSLLVVGCGIVLISRKRMENNK